MTTTMKMLYTSSPPAATFSFNLPSSSSPPLSPRASFPSTPRARILPPLAATATATASATEDRRSTCFSPRRITPSSSLYEILEIPSIATSDEIKAAYRRLARICHPDVATTDRKGSSANEFMKIHSAYSTLSDPEKRSVYDRKTYRRSKSLTSATSGFYGYTGRSWETDQCW